ncbi:hypothetical protein HPB52_006373 [Rhipicephalus sanguineus]|uniref:THAP-type domain-containing protein n=1 Tax=Rhipicephalus sanguineus TaxID=34632 RepID=A0A9D4Q594_RHISA|nr:hypothetical protein HPB52_006373 [Rhipicephalus sanguineus]
MPKNRHRHCYAPGCRTGYSGVKVTRKVSLFSVPKDEDRRKLWEKNLHRSDKPLDDQCAVCELHFEDRYILRDYIHVVNGEEVRIPRGVPALTCDAVPTILPNAPKYLTKKVPAERAPRKREPSAQLQSERRKKKRDASPCGTTALQDNDDDDCSSPRIDAENLGQLKAPSTCWYALPVLPLPPKSSPDKNLLAKVPSSQEDQDSYPEVKVDSTKTPAPL